MAGSVSWWRVPDVVTSNASTTTKAFCEAAFCRPVPDHQCMARVGEARCREVRRLDLFRGRIQIDLGDEGTVQEHASDPALVSASADPVDRRARKGESRLRAWRRRQPSGPGAPRSE